MATFEITLRRVTYARVKVEAETMAAARKQIAADEENTYELFVSTNEVWHDGQIKIATAKRVED